MARGWESKAVEEQLDSLQRQKELQAKPVLSDAERQQQAKRRGLRLSRARILKDLETARDRRYRELLERSLAHVEAELERLDLAEDNR